MASRLPWLDGGAAVQEQVRLDYNDASADNAVNLVVPNPREDRSSKLLEKLTASITSTKSKRSVSVDHETLGVRFRYRELVRQFAEKRPQADLLLSYLDQDWSQGDAQLHSTFTRFIVSDILSTGEANTTELGCSHYKDERDIRDTLTHTVADTCVRLIVVPDLSPVVVGLLGDTFDINPIVFAAALQNIWREPDTEPGAINRVCLDKSFDDTLFLYDCTTELSTTLMFYSNQLTFNELHSKLNSSELTMFVDSAVMEQDCIDKFGSRALRALHPLLCPPVRKTSTGIAELCRSYQAMNRLIGFQVQDTEVPIFLLLTTASNDWCERDRHLVEAARLHHNLPGWVDRLTSRMSKQLETTIVNIQTRDRGNPFFSPFLGYGSSSSQWRKELRSSDESANQWETLAAYYTRDLVPIIAKLRDTPEKVMFEMNLWATERAVEAFEETITLSRARLDWFKANTALHKGVPISQRIEVLRDHRDTLEYDQNCIDAHIKKFQVSQINTIEYTAISNHKRRTQMETIILRLRESRSGLQAIVQMNEKLIQDCLFDLQLELTNTQLIESRRSIEQNETVKHLTMLAFVFIPISAVAGIFGMNVQGISEVDPQIFVITALSVLVLSCLVAGYQNVLALFNAIEAAAFQYAKLCSSSEILAGEQTSTTKPPILKSVCVKILKFLQQLPALLAYLCVFLFALISLLLLPIEIGLYLLKKGIDFGKTQEKQQSYRRIRVKDAWVRDMVRVSSKAWREKWKQYPRWLQYLSRILYLPALFYAYITHHLDPQV